MRLIPVNGHSPYHLRLLWDLLEQRPTEARISHKEMPTWEEHEQFVLNHPFHDWCLIEVDTSPQAGSRAEIIGSVSLSQPAKTSVSGDQLSVDIFQRFRSHGFAEKALMLMIKKHPRPRYLAHTALFHYASMALFAKLGFEECERTFELIVPQEPAE